MSQETYSAVDEAESKDTLSIAQIRSLVGLPSTDSQNEESVPADSSVAVADSSNALIDTEDFEETEGPTQKKLWQQPLPKLIAVAVPVGIISLVLGILLANFTKVRLVEDEPEDANTAEEVVATADPEALKDEEIARLKTSNALGNQATVLDSQESRRTELTPTYREKFTTSRPETETREPQATPRQSATTVAPTSVRSRPTSVPRPVPSVPAMRAPTTVRSTASYTPPPRAAAPASNTTSRARTSAPVTAVTSSPQRTDSSALDPFEQWQKLVSLGSYGEIEESSVEQDSTEDTGDIATASQTPASQLIPVTVNNAASGADTPAVLASSRNKAEDSGLTEVVQAATYEEGVDFIMRDPPIGYEVEEPIIEVAPGVKARGEVIAPVAWAGDIESTVGSVELSEDLVSGGAVIMPAGTQLIVAVRSMSLSGMMDLQVTSIVLPWTGYEEMQIPPDAISVQGGNGQVLMAKDISGREGELRQLDNNQALLGALGQIGTILNRPNSQSTSTGAGGSYSTADYGSPSILGAILEGGANTLIAQRQARNQERVEQIEDLPSVWVLEAGTNIEVFINQPLAWPSN